MIIISIKVLILNKCHSWKNFDFLEIKIQVGIISIHKITIKNNHKILMSRKIYYSNFKIKLCRNCLIKKNNKKLL